MFDHFARLGLKPLNSLFHFWKKLMRQIIENYRPSQEILVFPLGLPCDRKTSGLVTKTLEEQTQTQLKNEKPKICFLWTVLLTFTIQKLLAKYFVKFEKDNTGDMQHNFY